MSESIDIDTLSSRQEITSLDLSCLNCNDYLNLILQRSEVMFDIPRSGRIIKAWNNNDSGPIDAVVDKLGAKIAQRAAAVIYEEYLALEELLKELEPKRLADIGCGYGFFDIFAAKATKAEIVLIDLEENEHRHFGFRDEGAAYSSLKVARQLLVANNVAPEHIACVNPRDTPPEDIEPVDLIVSFLSCGFHYPIDSYLPMIDKALKLGGAAIFDLRSKGGSQQVEKLAQFGTVTEIAKMAKHSRVLLQKSR